MSIVGRGTPSSKIATRVPPLPPVSVAAIEVAAPGSGSKSIAVAAMGPMLLGAAGIEDIGPATGGVLATENLRKDWAMSKPTQSVAPSSESASWRGFGSIDTVASTVPAVASTEKSESGSWGAS